MNEATMGERIKALREAAGLNEKQLAVQSEIPYRAIKKIERGMQTPRLKEILKLSRIFNVTTDYLFGAIESDPAPPPQTNN
jgi:transcriptional regulator with XRE-family HTH domain